MLTVHHLQLSQSERILWLCEELGVPYNLKIYTRDPLVSPQALKDVPGNTLGRAPFIEDTNPLTNTPVRLGESAAIVEYIITVHGAGRLALAPSHPRYAEYLYWFHYANGNVQPTMLVSMFVDNAGGPADGPTQGFADGRLKGMVDEIEGRLQATGKFLAGDEFTAADIMTVYSLTTQRYFGPVGEKIGYGKHPGIVAWLKRCSEREAYQKAMAKGDPDMRLLLGAEAPQQSLMAIGGSKSDAWKKK